MKPFLLALVFLSVQAFAADTTRTFSASTSVISNPARGWHNSAMVYDLENPTADDLQKAVGDSLGWTVVLLVQRLHDFRCSLI